MSAIRITTHFNIDLEFESAPFHRRLFAWVLDTVVLIIYTLVAIRVMSSFRSYDSGMTQALYMLFLVPFLVYHLVSEILMKGQSIGKRITRIQVVSENGGRASVGQLVIRWLIRTSDFMVVVIIVYTPFAAQNGDLSYLWKVGIPFGLLFTDLILMNTKKQQRLGDLLAHTLVISTNKKQSITDTVFLEVDQDYVPSFPQVMRLSDKDINALKGILDAARKRHDYSLAEMAAQKISNHLRIQTSLSAFDFLEVLLKDYNYLSTH